jgi:hypothetical protein
MTSGDVGQGQGLVFGRGIDAKLAEHQAKRVAEAAIRPRVVVCPSPGRHLRVEQLQLEHGAGDAADQKPLGEARLSADLSKQLGLAFPQKLALA